MAQIRSFVTGASGFVGARLANRLVCAGHHVTAFVRPRSRVSTLSRAMTLVEGDLRDSASIRGFENADIVFHLAAVLMGRTKGDFFSTNVDGTVNLLAALRVSHRKLRRFLYMSSLSAAGPAYNGVPLTEQMAPAPISWYGASKLAAEKAVMQFHSPDSPVTILRPGAILGAGADDLSTLAFRLARKRIGLRLSRSARRLSFVHVDDVVQAALNASSSPTASGRVYFVAAAPPEELNELLRLGAVLTSGSPVMSLTVGPRMQYAAAAIGELYAALTRTQPKFTRDKRVELRAPDWMCSADAARRDFGWEATISVRDAIAQLARAHG